MKAPDREERDEELYLLTGPTAVGKTELALQWAEAHGAEIVSCDSLLFYRGMDIGTAKPSRQERARAPHHLIDVAEPSEPWSIHRYLIEAERVVAGIRQRERKVLVTGGSGFYFKAFFAPVVDDLQVDPAVVEKVDGWEREGWEAMRQALLRLDPEAEKLIDLHNHRRVRKALERCLQTGKTVRELREAMAGRPHPFDRFVPRITLLTRDPDDLQARIAARVDGMLAAGLIEEVAALRERGLEKNPSAASAIGYRETLRYLRGELSREELREEIVVNTRRLVKKQMTWFRHQLPPGISHLNLSRQAVSPGTLFG